MSEVYNISGQSKSCVACCNFFGSTSLAMIKLQAADESDVELSWFPHATFAQSPSCQAHAGLLRVAFWESIVTYFYRFWLNIGLLITL